MALPPRRSRRRAWTSRARRSARAPHAKVSHAYGIESFESRSVHVRTFASVTSEGRRSSSLESCQRGGNANALRLSGGEHVEELTVLGVPVLARDRGVQQ